MKERTIYDSFSLPLNVGDFVCFTLRMKDEQRPIVKAKIIEIHRGENRNTYGEYTDWIVPEYVDSSDVQWAESEQRLPKKISPRRLVKCY